MRWVSPVAAVSGIHRVDYKAGMSPDTRMIADMFKSVSLGAPENAVGFVMWRITHRYQRAVDQALRRHGLTHLQFVTLTLAAWMGRAGKSATQAEIARFGDIHPMQISTIMKSLEGKALIERRPAPGSGPAKTVALTLSGIEALKIALPLVIEVQHRLFGPEGRPGGSLLQTLLALDGTTESA